MAFPSKIKNFFTIIPMSKSKIKDNLFLLHTYKFTGAGMDTIIYRLGVDIGSTTAKVVILDSFGEIVFSSYRRHNTETLETLRTMLNEATKKLGNAQIEVLITGSAGMGIAETYNLMDTPYEQVYLRRIEQCSNKVSENIHIIK